jgi:hypothetical protein
MALVNFTNLDFDQIKTSIKDYLRSNSNFTDYDFEGSNLSAIIDVLAYNTYISSYNANMVSNEVFIDSATLRENVVSLSRNIGYVPKSRTSARATVSFFVDTTGFTTNPLTLTLRKGIVCTSASNFGAESYTFSIPDDITVPVVNGIASFDSVEVYEGTYLNQTFTVDSNNPNQRFILPNANIDTKLLRVLVRNTEQSSITRKFTLSDNLIGVNAESKVFFIQEIEDQRYELIFGDNVFGKKLDNLNFIEVAYVVTNGESGNGVSSFTFNGRIIDNNETVVSSGLSLLTTDVNSQYGAEIESINSIKKYAPRIYASQNRAVTASDYEAIVPTIYPEAESISVFGGEELNPPRYGKVYISIKPYNGAFVPNTIKDNIINGLRKYSVAGIVPEILDLKYLYIEFDSTVYYNSNTAASANALKTTITSNIEKYADSTELNKYGARFKYSKFLKIIDDSNQAITSNITKIIMRRDGKISTNQLTRYEICFGNQFHIRDLKNGYNIKTSGFNVDGISDTVYFSDIPNSDGKLGRIFLFTLKSPTEPIIVRDNIGSIDYEKGEILLNPINITKTSKTVSGVPIIEVSAIPQSNDVIGLQDLYLQLDINNSVLNMVSDEISSGTNISGSNYTVTSSYTNGALVRS